jgi:hypothetical protein
VHIVDSAPVEAGKLTTDPDLNPKPRARLLQIDWSSTVVATEAEALALWQRIAPTGEDWEPKLDEIPDTPIASQLALALLRGGNFTCVPARPPRDCGSNVSPDIEPPLPQATLEDPCLRRMLALWAISSLDEADLPAARDALRTIAAIPPPESQLVASALEVLPATDQAGRLELRGIAFRAGHRALVNTMLSGLDTDLLIEAATKHHIDGALEALVPDSSREAFMSAVVDEAMAPAARTQAITELLSIVDGKLPRDLKTVLGITARKSPSCIVAAEAARALVASGDRSFAPIKPRARTEAAMMRAMCVLASYESIQRADEPSYLLAYVPAKGLEQVTITYDPYQDIDTDGDGDPHTERTLVRVPRDEVVLPEIEQMIAAFDRCTGTTCMGEFTEFRFGFKPGPGGALQLARLEVVERPPCPTRFASPGSAGARSGAGGAVESIK